MIFLKSFEVFMACYYIFNVNNGVAKRLNKLHTSKGDYWIKNRASLQRGISLKGNNLLQEGVNSLL